MRVEEDSGRPVAILRVAKGADRYGERRPLGISNVAFKVTPADGAGVLVLENTFHAPGGPARHLHYHQDEWFYVAEGEFQMEIGPERFELRQGDSILGPRGVPHVWASTGSAASDAPGRIVIAFFPAGQMEAFFREVTQANTMPPQDPELWRRHGMELLGPPLRIE